MKTITIDIAGQQHELPADTPEEKIKEYVEAVMQYCTIQVPVKKTNGHTTVAEMKNAMVRFLAGQE